MGGICFMESFREGEVPGKDQRVYGEAVAVRRLSDSKFRRHGSLDLSRQLADFELDGVDRLGAGVGPGIGIELLLDFLHQEAELLGYR